MPSHREKINTNISGKPESCKTGATEDSKETLVGQFERAPRAREATYSPTKKIIDEELDAVRRSRGNSPVAKLAGKFDSAARYPHPLSKGTDAEKVCAVDMKESAKAIFVSCDGQDRAKIGTNEYERNNLLEKPDSVEKLSLDSENITEDQDSISSDSVSTNADTAEMQNERNSISIYEDDEGGHEWSETVEESDPRKSHLNDDELKDDELQAEKGRGEYECGMVDYSMIASDKAADQMNTGVMLDANEPFMSGLGWVMVGLVTIVGIGLTCMHRIKRKC